MEAFKSLEELTQMDEKHRLMGALSGSVPSLELMHKYLSGVIAVFPAHACLPAE